MSSELSPQQEDKKQRILSALASEDLALLRTLSSEEGGYVDDETRAKVWPFLLGLELPLSSPEPTKEVKPANGLPPSSTLSPSSSSSSPDPRSPVTPPQPTLVPTSPRPITPTHPRELSQADSLLTDGGSALSESWIHPPSSASTSSAHPTETSQRSSFSFEDETASLAARSNAALGESWVGGNGGGTDGSVMSSSVLSSAGLRTDEGDTPASSFADTIATSVASPSSSPSPSKRSSSPSSSRSNSPQPPADQPANGGVTTSLLFPSPTQSFAHLPPLPSSPPLAPPPPEYSSSAKEAGAAPVEWGMFASGGADELPAHRDEGQIRLDTRRGFVVWPEVTQKARLRLQSCLHALIVTVLRRHPPFRYFQGYHDISSVFLLTLLPISSLLPPPTPQHSRSRSQSRESPTPQPTAEETAATTDEDAQRAELCARCLERLSLFRIRDGMGEGLEPVMGLLRLMKRLLRVADPELARMVNQATPLPFFALSWLLTLFSHDVDSFPIVQLLFDFLLSHNPVAVVYLSVAIILSKKPLITSLSPYLYSDPGLLHTTLSSLPPFLVSSASTTANTSPTTSPTPALAPGSPTSSDSPPTSPSHPPIPLPDLFALTTTLLSSHPPFASASKGGLAIEEVMGRRSVVFTYEEEWAALHITINSSSDAERVAEAERVVSQLGEMVNLGYIEEEDSSDEMGEEKGEKERKGIVRAGKRKRDAGGVGGTGVPGWAVGIAVLVVVGAVGVGVWGGSGGARARGGGAGWKAWIEGGGLVGGVWEWVGGGGIGRG